jgi:hypothetical protein
VKTRRVWEDNITIDIKEVGWEDVDWINLARGRFKWRAVVTAVMKFRFP